MPYDKTDYDFLLVRSLNNIHTTMVGINDKLTIIPNNRTLNNNIQICTTNISRTNNVTYNCVVVCKFTSQNIIEIVDNYRYSNNYADTSLSQLKICNIYGVIVNK